MNKNDLLTNFKNFKSKILDKEYATIEETQEYIKETKEYVDDSLKNALNEDTLMEFKTDVLDKEYVAPSDDNEYKIYFPYGSYPDCISLLENRWGANFAYKTYKLDGNIWDRTEAKDYLSICVPVTEDEKYYYKGYGINANNPNIIFVTDVLTNENSTQNVTKIISSIAGDFSAGTEFIIPKNCKFIYVQAPSNKYFTLTLQLLKKEDINFELHSAENERKAVRDINKNKETFSWKPFDKAYFAFVLDDSNIHLPRIYQLFHSKNVPLSSACIVDFLDHPWNGLTVAEWNKKIVDDGGEILAHYSANLAPKGTLNTATKIYKTSEEDWLKCTRDVKAKLIDYGFDCRGLIGADYTIHNTQYGEEICQRYFDYSDNIGISTQYNLQRIFINQWKDLQTAKNNIEYYAARPGFYPICMHGNETCCADDVTLTELIDFILGKGGVITTYANVYDTFGILMDESNLVDFDTEWEV